MALTGDGRGRGGPSPPEAPGRSPKTITTPLKYPPETEDISNSSTNSKRKAIQSNTYLPGLTKHQEAKAMFKIQTLNKISDIIYTQLSADNYTVSNEEPVPEGLTNMG